MHVSNRKDTGQLGKNDAAISGAGNSKGMEGGGEGEPSI